MNYNNEINIDLIELDIVKGKIIYLYSYIGFIIYFFSIFTVIFYLKKTAFIKSKSFSFILLSSITGFIEMYSKENDFIFKKEILIYFSYIIQFHLVITSINKTLIGKYIFKSEKNFSIKYLSLIKFILLPIIIFPYSLYINKYIPYIKFFQYIVIIISILYFYDYIKKNIIELINYLRGNIKDNILIPYIEQDELIKIYMIIDNLCSLFFIFALIYYIFKLFDLLLIKIYTIHFIINLIMLIIKITFK